MQTLFNTALSLLFSALLLAFSSAATLAEKRVVLLIGNSDYKHVTRLANPANDVRLLAPVFADLGFEVMERQDVGYIGLKKAIRDFTAKLKNYGPDTVGFFFYAGHGLQVDGLNYLVPVDAEIEKEADIALYSIDANALMQGLITVGNRLNVIVLDSCRNNPYKSGTRGLSGGLARMDAPQGSMIAYATSPGNVAEDGDSGNSPFSNALAAELRKPGAYIEMVMKRVRQRVFGATDGRQLPWSSSSIIGEFCPAGCRSGVIATDASTAAASEGKDPAHRAWLTIKDSKNPRILRAFGKKYPDSLYAEFARIKIEELKPGKPQMHTASASLIRSEKRTLGRNEGEEHGRFFVIMGSYKKADRVRALKRQLVLQKEKITAHLIDTDKYPNLTDGLYAVVMGPYNRDYAIFKKVRASQIVADAYIKSGR